MKNINDKLKKDNELNFKVNNIFFVNNKFNAPIEAQELIDTHELKP
jgi:hypothetical protein